MFSVFLKIHYSIYLFIYEKVKKQKQQQTNKMHNLLFLRWLINGYYFIKYARQLLLLGMGRLLHIHNLIYLIGYLR